MTLSFLCLYSAATISFSYLTTPRYNYEVNCSFGIDLIVSTLVFVVVVQLYSKKKSGIGKYNLLQCIANILAC